jgi:hypothetical protein
VAGRDITEGRSTRAIAVDVGVVSNTSIWQNTDIAYDVAIGGQPFIYAISDGNPYIRQTAPFRKEQFDNQTEPGEQSLTGWWIRSQSSFHNGAGITFFDPALVSNEGAYRFADSQGVDVWTEGQVTLLSSSTTAHVTTHPIESNGRSFQQLRSIQWTTSGTTYDGVLLHDGYDVDKIDSTGAETHFIDYNAGADDKVYAICDDGTTAFWVTNDTGPSGKLEVLKKSLDLTSVSAATSMFTAASVTVQNAVMEYVKERIVMCVNSSVYELSSNTSSLPSAVYTHSDSDHIFTSITASGPAIYISGFSGIQSNIYKFTLSTNGTMPTLNQAITAAEMPTGEIIHKIYYYLGYMMIGTNKGIRVATVNDQDGSISYGPLVVETTQPCYDFAARNHFVWCATSVAGNPGLIRIDLSTQTEPLVFAYANDIFFGGVTGLETTSCAFLGETERLAYCTEAKNQFAVTNKARAGSAATLTTSVSHGISIGESLYVIGVDNNLDGGPFTVTAANTNTLTYNTATTATVATTSATGFTGVAGYSYLQHPTDKITSGYLTTGYIRFNTLEPKNFKRLLGRGDFEYGSMTLETVDKDGTEYDLISYDASVPPVEVTTNQPPDSQEYLAYKFILYRDGTDSSKGPVFKGYQIKATIATPRQRVMRFPVFCYDVETDRYNVLVGYEGRAFERLAQLETIEETGDVVTFQDLTTGESRQCVIEQISFTRLTPPDRGFSGYGGILDITIRTV